jgi:hypothetical protein
LAVKALRSCDREALKELLEKLVSVAESARERVASAMEALRELDSLLAEGAVSEAKAHVRVASSRLHTASESLLEVAAALGAALAFVELAETQPASRGGGGS